MSVHDDEVSLRHMLDHAREAVALLQNRSRTDLGTDRLLTLARKAVEKSENYIRRKHILTSVEPIYAA